MKYLFGIALIFLIPLALLAQQTWPVAQPVGQQPAPIQRRPEGRLAEQLDKVEIDFAKKILTVHFESLYSESTMNVNVVDGVAIVRIEVFGISGDSVKYTKEWPLWDDSNKWKIIAADKTVRIER